MVWAVTSQRVTKLLPKIIKQLVDNKFTELTLITRPHNLIHKYDYFMDIMKTL